MTIPTAAPTTEREPVHTDECMKYGTESCLCDFNDRLIEFLKSKLDAVTAERDEAVKDAFAAVADAERAESSALAAKEQAFERAARYCFECAKASEECGAIALAAAQQTMGNEIKAMSTDAIRQLKGKSS